MNTNELVWGLKTLSQPCRCAWGARAIYSHKYGIELLWDRQSGIVAEDVADKVATTFDKWIGEALKKVSKHFIENCISTGADHEFRFDDGDKHIVANPRASFGYMYITAYQDEVKK